MTSQRGDTAVHSDDGVAAIGSRGGRLHRARRLAGHYASEYMVVLLVLAGFLILSIVNDHFWSVTNYQKIFLAASTFGTVGAGMTVLIINGAFDLSAAGIIAMTALTIVKVQPVAGLAVAVLLGIVTSLVLGTFNGFLVTRLRIPSFIGTLGLMYVYLGVGFMLIGTTERIPMANPWLMKYLFMEKIVGIPIGFLVMLVVYVAMYCYLRFTSYGRYTRAMGSNEAAARAAGLNVYLVRTIAFTLFGLCCGITGVLMLAKLSVASPVMASGIEFQAITVAVLGGTSLAGGRGTLFGSAVAAVLLALISTALNLLNVSAFYQYVFMGLILLAAAGLQAIRRN